MAAKEVFKVHGMKVEMWETSFRVEGAARAVWVGPHITREMVEQMVEAIYNSVYNEARETAIRKVSNQVAGEVRKYIGEVLKHDR